MRAGRALLAALLFAACGRGAPSGRADGAAPAVLRVGHFPNLTHAHGLAAHQLSRRGEGWFERRLAPGTKLEWFVYNAGPSAMEALLAGSLDLAYVGPNPALNAYVRSRGEEVRVLAGATRGGAALVVAGDGRIAGPEALRGRRVATPQLGNTQDVACRTWLASQGFKVTQLGGDVHVVPTQNPDMLVLFQRGDLDAAWTVEPWVTRLELEAGGRVLLEEREAVTTLLVASAGFLARRPELARAFVAAHRELSGWIEQNPAEAQALVRAELRDETSLDVSPELVARAWGRMRFGAEVPRTEMDRLVAAARAVGFLPEPVSLDRLFEVP